MKKLFTRPIPVLLLLFVLLFCEKEFDGERPFVRLITLPPTDLNAEGVTLNGEFLDLSGDIMSDYGFLIDAENIKPDVVKNPDILKFSLKTETPKLGRFSFRAEYSLSVGQTYYIRAYAIQGNNFILGEEFSFVSKGGAANPSITSFSPVDIVPGDTLTLVGQNFTLGLPRLSAYLAGKEAEIVGTPSNTQLKIRVPLGIPLSGKIQLTVGFISITLDKNYQRLKPDMLKVPGTVKYGASFLVECKNLSKIFGSNEVVIGKNGIYQSCLVLQQQKDALLVKLDDSNDYDPERGDSLFVFAAALPISSKVNIAKPEISGISPALVLPDDEVTLVCDGISTNKNVTKVSWNGAEIPSANYSIGATGKQVTLKVPYWGNIPGTIKVMVRSGQRVSNEMSTRVVVDLLTLNEEQKDWKYAFNLNDKLFIGLPSGEFPFEYLDPSKKASGLQRISSSSRQIFEHAFPTQNDQLLALSVENNSAVEGQLLGILANNTAQLIAKSTNKIPLSANSPATLKIRGIATKNNALSYLFVSNSPNNFWQFNASTRQFRSLLDLPLRSDREVRELILFDQGTKIIALVFYRDDPFIQINEYNPVQNTWQENYTVLDPFGSYNDAFIYPLENSFYFLLSSNRADQFALCNENLVINSRMPVLFDKEKFSAKKKAFFIGKRVVIIDNESIYRTHLGTE